MLASTRVVAGGGETWLEPGPPLEVRGAGFADGLSIREEDVVSIIRCVWGKQLSKNVCRIKQPFHVA